MNYRHGYHAGNFADVFKHIILVRLIKALLRKAKPICYIDAHAGAGRYDLTSPFAQKSQEAASGIIKLMELSRVNSSQKISAQQMPTPVQDYLEMIKQDQYPQYYSGSPLIAKRLLRPIDRLILMELHPEEYNLLKANLAGDKRIAIHQQNGYKTLKAFLPPKERRGLILIDPAFEQRAEWQQLLHILQEDFKKFPNGIYALWYPIKNLKFVRNFINAALSFNLPNSVNAEFRIYPDDAPLNLIGCGMLIINAPWQFSSELEEWLPWLWQRLSINGRGGYSIENGR